MTICLWQGQTAIVSDFRYLSSHTLCRWKSLSARIYPRVTFWLSRHSRACRAQGNIVVHETRSVANTTLVSAARISKADDRAMDRVASKAKPAPPGLSVRHGPVNGDAMHLDNGTNGAAKRKSRSSISKGVSYKDDSDSDDAAPLVRPTVRDFPRRSSPMMLIRLPGETSKEDQRNLG